MFTYKQKTHSFTHFFAHSYDCEQVITKILKLQMVDFGLK